MTAICRWPTPRRPASISTRRMAKRWATGRHRGRGPRCSASYPDFTYSDAMRKADRTWDDQTLDAYLTRGRDLVPGNKMLFAGLENEQDRLNLIAYLRTLK